MSSVCAEAHVTREDRKRVPMAAPPGRVPFRAADFQLEVSLSFPCPLYLFLPRARPEMLEFLPFRPFRERTTVSALCELLFGRVTLCRSSTWPGELLLLSHHVGTAVVNTPCITDHRRLLTSGGFRGACCGLRATSLRGRVWGALHPLSPAPLPHCVIGDAGLHLHC